MELYAIQVQSALKLLRGRIVATADRIAYVNHDIDDAIRAGALLEADLPQSTHKVLGKSFHSYSDFGARHD